MSIHRKGKRVTILSTACRVLACTMQELLLEHVLEKAHKRMAEQNRPSIEYDDIGQPFSAAQLKHLCTASVSDSTG